MFRLAKVFENSVNAYSENGAMLAELIWYLLAEYCSPDWPVWTWRLVPRHGHGRQGMSFLPKRSQEKAVGSRVNEMLLRVDLGNETEYVPRELGYLKFRVFSWTRFLSEM